MFLACISRNICAASEVNSRLSFGIQLQRWGSQEQSGAAVIRNDRAGRGKYQSKMCCSLGLWSCRFKAPRLLCSCQLIKATSQLIPAGIPHQTARGAFYPTQNAASCHGAGSSTSGTRMAEFNAAERKSITLLRWRSSNMRGETVKRSAG